ncbi:hypothetical protein [Rhodococcus erythropolis]|uniref:hypothetical protein n=1 Tax=Rhodococcus erythropolis TaxID=1833 RepID=UPI001CD96810|nr:hypothetical protein [Rhodococcus erythropolis]
MAGKSSARGSSTSTSTSRASTRSSASTPSARATAKPRASRTTRTVSTPRNVTTSARAGGRPASGKGSKPAPKKASGTSSAARRPVSKTSQRASPLAAVGKGIGAGWSLAARGVGATTRTVSKVGEIEAGHRRDGIALGLIAFSVVIAGGVWFKAGGPIGGGIDTLVRAIFGAASAVLPIVGVGLAILLMRTEPKPEIRPRLIMGSLLVGLPALGLWHIISGSPTDATGRSNGAGFVGYVVGGPAHQRAHRLAVCAAAGHRRRIRNPPSDRNDSA